MKSIWTGFSVVVALIAYGFLVGVGIYLAYDMTPRAIEKVSYKFQEYRDKRKARKFAAAV